MSESTLRTVQLYTDGACSGNPGPGGWAFILRDVPTRRELEGFGSDKNTTNNKMELKAVIEGLKSLKKKCRVEIYSDSKYVLQGLESWMAGWKRNGWKKKSRSGSSEIKNLELWKELDRLVSQHTVSFHHVRGHSGHPENERCDQLAVAAYQKLV